MLQPDSIRLGWALIHFIWQGLLIALVLEIALGLTGRKNASLRYLYCGLAIAAMPVCLTTTYWELGQHGSAITAQASSAHLAEQAVAEASSGQVTPAGLPLLPTFQKLTDFSSPGFSVFDLDRYMPGIVAGWLVGVVLLAGRKAGGFIVLWRLRRRGVSVPCEAMAESFREACRKIGVDPRRVCLRISTLAQVPMTMGWIRPVVLFPAALLSGLSTGEIELLLAHELAHIRRGDYLVNLLQSAVETLFFYHPVTWWISRRMRQERENACDDLVASRSTEALAYAKVLLQLETLRPSASTLVSAANGGSLLQRVQRLIGDPAPASSIGLPVLLVLISILGVIAAVSVVKAQAIPPAKPPVTMTEAEARSKSVAAIVNGHPILWSAVEAQSAETESVLKKNFSGDELNQKIEGARQNVLKALIERELIIDDFKLNGGFIPKSYTEARIDDIVKADFGGDRKAFLAELAKQGSSQEKCGQEIESNAIVGYMRNKFVEEKVRKYYLDHPELFPQDELVNVTCIEIRGAEPVPDNKTGSPASDADPQAKLAHQILLQLRAGANASDLTQKYSNLGPQSELGKPVWFSQDYFPSWWPISWADVEKLKPNQTTDVITGYGDFAQDNGLSKRYPYYYILRLNDRRPARIASTPETEERKKSLLNIEREKIQEAWLGSLRSKAQIQTFVEADTDAGADGTPSIIKTSYVPSDEVAANDAAPASASQAANIPVAQPAPAPPEPAFAQPVTMKEIKGNGPGVTRLYYQGGNLILQQETGVSPGSIGQIVFYNHTEVVADVVSSRTILPNNFKINVQSIAADSISPAKLRILDSSHEIISEFFIDQTGLMRPITKAEHDDDLARRKAAFSKLPPANNSTAEPSQSTR